MSIKNLKYRCYKVLPLVYDDSLSYYEVLCKIFYKLNELIDNINDNLTTYIDEYVNENWSDILETILSKMDLTLTYTFYSDSHTLEMPSSVTINE